MRRTRGRANPVDAQVGARVRLRRTLLGMSQEKLGEALGLTFQQVQKYERGANRIGASRLHQISQVLEVPVSFFFEDVVEAAAVPGGGLGEERAGAEFDHMNRRETLELVRAYYRIGDPKVRRRLFELAKALGDDRPPSTDEALDEASPG